MTPRLKSSRAARDLIKAHEPFHGEATRRGKRWVVGYGHTAAAKPGVSVSKDNAELLLIYDVLQAENAVHAALGEDIPAPVRDALVSFAASVGVNAFKVSDVARLARAGKIAAAADALETWVRAEEDGRLVTSQRLVTRRAAEKALMLSDAAPAAPEPEAEPAALPGPAAEAPEVADPEAGGPEVREPGPLIDVDIAFEEPDAAPAAVEPVAEGEPVAEAEPEPDREPAPEVEPEPAVDPEAPVAPEAVAEAVESAPAEVDPASAVKASQDAAIQAVMARMAGEIAQSVSVAGVPRPEEASEPQAESRPEAATPDRDLAEVQLGYAFLMPSVVGVIIDPDDEPAAEPQPAAEPDTGNGSSNDTGDDTADESAGEAAGPGRAVASPAPGPVYATVAVGPVEKSDTAPPHPAESPAASPGMSGESEGPDHPEDGDHEDAGEEEAELEPAIVAGPEASYIAEETPPGAVEGRGDWVHTANLVAGTALTGLGAWQLGSNLDAYLAQGLGYNWFGPAAFAGGVLLLVSSGWVVVGKMTSKKKS